MMSDDGTRDPGLDELAAFQFGRWSAESDAELSRIMDSMRQARGGGTGEVGQLLAANAALRAENAALIAEKIQLQKQVNLYKYNYDVLKEWADRAASDLKWFRSRES